MTPAERPKKAAQNIPWFPLDVSTFRAYCASMKTNTTTNIQLKPLYTGQTVAVANCSTLATVVRREGKNQYTIKMGETVVEHVRRLMLAVNVQGTFRHGAHNETL